MNDGRSQPDDSLELSTLEQISEASDEFETLWRDGKAPRIEDFLARYRHCDRSTLLSHLLAIELELRRSEGGIRWPRSIKRGSRMGPPRSRPRFRNRSTAWRARDREWLTRRARWLPWARWTRRRRSTPTGIRNPAGRELRGTRAAQPPGFTDGRTDAAGRYTLKDLLGEGNFGRVYLAHDRDLRRDVAIKVPRTDSFTTESQLESFVSEARLAAGLKHPSIIAVHDIIRLDGNEIWIVLELIRGRSLSQMIRERSISHDMAAEIVAGVAEAADHAHKMGLVHRDLKPSNILVDGQGRPIVTDFGLAIHEVERPPEPWEIAGTPAYMAPEQVRGESHRLSGQTDVWALGAVLYEALTGQRPFSGDRDQVFDEILHREVEPPRQIDGTIPRELERICLRCLSKGMTDRYATAADLAADLRCWRRKLRGQGTRGRTGAGHRGERLVHHVVPKGLRAFDAHDSAFFLSLLPGPRDREGVPERCASGSTGP